MIVFQVMANLKVVFFHLFILPIVYALEDCQFSMCGKSKIIIRFPFTLQGEQPQRCGYPGFTLTCTNGSQTVLKLPYSGDFYVRNINYLTQQIQLRDPQNCLPKRLLSLNLSGSPLAAVFRRNYTFLSCPYRNTGSEFTAIDCLSSSTNFVSAIPSAVLGNSTPNGCDVINRPSIAVGGDEESYRDDLTEDLRLTWRTPDCRACESQQGTCGFENRSNDRIGCFPRSQTGNSADGLRLFRIITLAITGPAVICVSIVTCYACFLDSRRGITPRRSGSPEPATATSTTMGLDEPTIESYQKVVLGESRRLPQGPNDGTCAICLSEYLTRDAVRCIPQCNHCFHSQCIDEWLRLNGTCPVCRSFPSPSNSSCPISINT